MFGMVPLWAWKWGAIVLVAIGVLLVYGHWRYKAGYQAMEVQYLEFKVHVAAEGVKAAEKAREVERERETSVRKADVVHDKQVRVAGDTAAAYRRGLRDAAASANRNRVSDRPIAADGCAECPRCATAAELLGVGEVLVGVAENADRERATAIACATAWPTR